MAKKKKQLSHAEVWDDSALLQSWDDALEEYKLYHSIHARGERVEDVIKDFEENGELNVANGDAVPENSTNAGANDAMEHDLEDGELEEDIESAPVAHIESSIDQGRHEDSAKTEQSHAHPQTNAGVQQPPMPEVVMSSVKDEALKNLMMSWYYAGYYTGLYEGQQVAQKAAPS